MANLNRQRVILASLTERNARLLTCCQDLAHATLTPAEKAAVLPNAALIDRDNLQLLTRAAPSAIDAGPIGATDLTNPINQSAVVVPLHPVISLHEEIVHWLEARGQGPLAREGRALVHEVSAIHERSLQMHRLPVEWPDLRKRWEEAIDKAGVVPTPKQPKAKQKKPRLGVSPEWIARSLALRADLVPNLPNLAAASSSGSLTPKAKQRALTQIRDWDVMNSHLMSLYEKEVCEPMEASGRAWMFTCKSLKPEQEERLAKYLTAVRGFSQTQPPIEEMVVSQGVETAALTMLTPTTDEKTFRRRLGVFHTLGTTTLQKVSKHGVERGTEAVEDIALNAMGPTSKLLYFAAKMFYKAIGSPGEEMIEDKVDGVLGKITDTLRDKLERHGFGRNYPAQLEQRLKVLSSRSPLGNSDTPHVVYDLSPEGLRVAGLLANIYATAQNPAIVTAFEGERHRHGDREFTQTLHDFLAPTEARTTKPNLNLPLNFEGDKRETATAERLTIALLARKHFPPAGDLCHDVWVKGANRISHLQNVYAEQVRREIEISDEPPREDVTHLRTLYGLARVIERSAQLTPNGNPGLTPISLSELTSAVEASVVATDGRVANRRERGDWELTYALNIGLAVGSIHPAHLKEELGVTQDPALEELTAAESRSLARAAASVQRPVLPTA